MKSINALRQDLNKTLINLGFVAAALMTCVLGFTASAYTDQMNDKSYSIFEAYFTFDSKFISENSEFASVLLFRNGLSGYVAMFIPIIVAFPFMVSFCAERNNGLMRFTISRTGKLRYYLSKFFASFISGGLAVLIGMVLFGLIVWILFPSYKNYDLDPEMTEMLLPDGMLSTVSRHLLSAFLYGAFSTLPAFFISSFCKNPYIITCLPFMLTYVWTTGINKITAKAMENMDFEILDKVDPFRPDSVKRLAYLHFDNTQPLMRNTLIFNLVYLFVLLAGFIIIMNLRTDKGN